MTDLYIPTRGRVGRQQTWGWLSPAWQARAVLVCSAEEAPLHVGLPTLVCPGEGIAFKRQWIVDQHGDEPFFMMDDDLNFAKRRTDDSTKLVPLAGAADFDAMMDALFAGFVIAPMVGLASRSGANRETTPLRLNGRIHEVMGLDPAAMRRHGVQMNRLEFMEDFDTVLQFLAAGQPTVMINSYTKDDRGSNVAGGCSLYRDALGQAMAAHELEDLWPEFVTLVERPGWAGMGGTRTDVRVAWKKAYLKGLRAHADSV